jgi:hypothetical protein
MTTEATPSWTGIGADYAAWVRACRYDPSNLEAAINKDAPKRAYLAVMNGAKICRFSTTYTGGRHPPEDAFALTGALWHSRGRSGMHTDPPPL